jgi:hypothetical protein
MKLARGSGLVESGKRGSFGVRVLCVARPERLEESALWGGVGADFTGHSEVKLAIAAMILASKLAVLGTSPLTRFKTSIWQDPAFEIQILPAEKSWRSSSAVGIARQDGGRIIEKELERVRDRSGLFPATLMLPRSTETPSMAVPSKSARRWTGAIRNALLGGGGSSDDGEVDPADRMSTCQKLEK